MATALQGPTEREVRISQALREKSVREIQRVGEKQAAKRLDMTESGIRSLLWRQRWSLEVAFRVADALDIDTNEIEELVQG